MELKIRFCKLMVRDEELSKTHKNDGQREQIQRQMKEIIFEYKKAGGNVPTVAFWGQLNGQDQELSHFDIDEIIKHSFPEDTVWPKSEQTTFFCDSVTEMADELEDFLAKEFTGLDFKKREIKEDEWTIPEINSWELAKDYLNSHLN